MEKTCIIGLGNMGEAMAAVLLRAGIPRQNIVGVEARENRRTYISERYAVSVLPDLTTVPGDVHSFVLAVKPQDAKKILQPLATFLRTDQICISIMAGITMGSILSLLGTEAKIARAMPNIAVKVAKGAIGVCFNDLMEKGDRESVDELLSIFGTVVEVEEEMMDAVTALGGSGPGFFLLFLEGMIDGGVKMGLSREKARAISLQVVQGISAMLDEEDLHLTVLREIITSPGGTTIAGLAVLEERAFKGSVIRALEEARKRAKELSL